MLPETIAKCAKACHTLFDACMCNERCESKEAIEEQLGRFNLWGKNSGIFAAGYASLDFRLRDAPHIREAVVSILEALRADLVLLNSIVTQEDGALNIPKVINSVGTRSSDLSSTFSGSDSSSEHSPEFEVIEMVSDVLNRLIGWSSLIRNSSIQHRNIKAATFIERDEDGDDVSPMLEEYFRRFIHNRHKDISGAICERLGKAALLRRKRILYSKSHQMKLASTVPSFRQKDGLAQKSEIREAIQTTVGTPYPPPTRVAIPLSETVATSINFDKFSPTVRSSVVSSFRSHNFIREEVIDYPRPPRMDGQECLCPYCSTLITGEITLDTKNWVKHIMQDIQPYICLLEPCNSSETYSTEKEWLDHSRDHKRQWCCPWPTHDQVLFDSQDQLEVHLIEAHEEIEPQARLLSELGDEWTEQPFDVCPLCKIPQRNVRAENLPRHIANHLISLTLILLPRDIGEFEEDLDTDDGDPMLVSAAASQNESLDFQEFEYSIEDDSAPSKEQSLEGKGGYSQENIPLVDTLDSALPLDVLWSFKRGVKLENDPILVHFGKVQLELDEEERVLKTFVDQSGQTAEQLQAIKLNQTIRGINSEDSEVRLGMPASVVDKVAQQSITDITSKNKSKVIVGIW